MAAGPAVDFKIEGIEQTNRIMRSIDMKIRKKVVRKSVRVGTNVLTKEARELAPEETGALKLSQYTYIKWEAAKGRFWGQVRTRKKKYGYRSPKYYKHLVALGTKHSKAQNFYEQAFTFKHREALKEFQQDYKAGVNAVARGEART